MLDARHVVVLLVLSLFIALSMPGCSSDSPTSPEPDRNEGPRREPLGVLLEGDPDSRAMDALIELAPYPADEAHIDEDGWIATRLMVAIAPDATVGQVNDALIDAGARIISMMPGSPAFSLVLDPMASIEEADSLIARLAASPAFLFAFPSYVVDPVLPVETAGGSAGRRDMPAGGSPDVAHLQDARIPAMWNVRGLVTGPRFPVLIPDEYYVDKRHPDISAQRFPPGSGALTTQRRRKGDFVGNHGFAVTGLIGANWDDDVTLGVHPDSLALDLISVPTGGVDWTGLIHEIRIHVPPSGNFVLNTSLGFNDPDFTTYDKVQRVHLGMLWRQYAHVDRDRFLHATATGNDGREDYSLWNSPFTVSASQGNLPALLGSDYPADRSRLEAIWTQLTSTLPGVEQSPENVLLVGSSDAQTGVRSSFSNHPADVRMVGSDVTCVCLRDDSRCMSGTQFAEGTSLSAPQVAGLAAYLWTIEPTLPVAKIRSEIVRAYSEGDQEGVVDGYALVLGLDKSLSGAKVRRELLDVADAQGQPGGDGRFDERDLQLYLERFRFYETEREGPGGVFIDNSRYDLNGDGFTGGSGRAKFDLDVNDPFAFSTITQTRGADTKSFDETILSDLEILCYYAFSELYQGDPQVRDTLLAECQPSVRLITQFPDVVLPGQPATLTVGAASISGQIIPAPRTELGYVVQADTTWLSGLDLQLTSTGGSLGATSGITDASGKFTTTGTIDADAGALDITINAFRNGSEVASAVERALNGAPGISFRNVWLATATQAMANNGFTVDEQVGQDALEEFMTDNLASGSEAASSTGVQLAMTTGDASLAVTYTEDWTSGTPLVITFAAAAQTSAGTRNDPNLSVRPSGTAQGGAGGQFYFTVERGNLQLVVEASLAAEGDNLTYAQVRIGDSPYVSAFQGQTNSLSETYPLTVGEEYQVILTTSSRLTVGGDGIVNLAGNVTASMTLRFEVVP